MNRASHAVKEDKDPGSVKSLLAILRQQQDSPQPAAAATPASTGNLQATSRPQPPFAPHNRYASWIPPAAPSAPGTPASGDPTSATPPALPSNQDLQSLLKALNPGSSSGSGLPAVPSYASRYTLPASYTAYAPAAPAPTRSADPTRPPPNKSTSESTTSHAKTFATEAPAHAAPPAAKRPKLAHQATADERREMPLSRALPVLAGLLEDTQFTGSLKKLKTRQDALEKDLWKRRQGIFQQYSQRMEASLHTAQILGGKTVPPSESAAQKAWLDRTLRAFYLEQCLPQLDALAREQAAALDRLGVPGLGAAEEEGADGQGDGGKEGMDKARAKRARIMSVLDGVLAED